MRVLLAALIFFGGITGSIGLSGYLPSWLRGPLVGTVAIVLLFLVLWVFNGPKDLLGEDQDRRSRTEKFERQMRDTKFPELEEALGFVLPESLKRSYADDDLVLRQFFQVIGGHGETWDLQGFLPADPGNRIE